MTVNLTALVANAFKVVGASVNGALKTATYVHVTGASVYDPETGETTNPTTTYTVSVVLTGYSERDREIEFYSQNKRNIEVGDMKALIPYADLPVDPTLEDTITINGVEWRVLSKKIDPTNTAMHTLQLRIA